MVDRAQQAQPRDRPAGARAPARPPPAWPAARRSRAASRRRRRPRRHDGRAARAGGRDVGEQRGDAELEPGPHLVVGGRQHGHERPAQHLPRRAGVLHPLHHACRGRPGPLHRPLQVPRGDVVDRPRGRDEGERG